MVLKISQQMLDPNDEGPPVEPFVGPINDVSLPTIGNQQAQGPLGLRLHYLPRIFAQEAPASDARCANCDDEHSAGSEGPTAVFSCRHCFGPGLLCRICLHATHRRLPFHKIRKWIDGVDGGSFVDTSLCDTGLVIHVGHKGNPCQFYEGTAAPLTVVHEYGVFKVNIAYCECHDGIEKHQQLFDAGIFPSSEKRPESGFTFSVLDHFLIYSIRSKMAAWDYWQSLVALSDSVDSKSVPVSYQSFAFYCLKRNSIKLHSY